METQENLQSNESPSPAQPQVVVAKSPKSLGIALLLTFLFGPVGLLYSTVKGGVIMIVVAIVLGFLTLGLSCLVVWPVTIVWSYLAVKNYNKALYAGQV